MERRDIFLKFVVTAAERRKIEEKMAQYGCTNMSAYLRKMALDGYVVNISLPELRTVSALLQRAGGNLNQIARRANGTRQVYDADLQEILDNQRQLLSLMGKIMDSLSALE